MNRRLSIRARAWLALLLPPAIWFGFEQGLSALLHAHCEAAPIGIFCGVASLALCGAAAYLAWPVKEDEGEVTHPWIAHMAIAVAGIFSLAIVFQTLALWLVPPCVG